MLLHPLKGLTQEEQVEHIAKFISGLWQIHPFGEGNTRTTAVFAMIIRIINITEAERPLFPAQQKISIAPHG